LLTAATVLHDSGKCCIVKTALEKDAWTITNDPLVIQYGAKDLFVDLGAEKIIAAEKIGRKIAVEMKSFLGAFENIQNMQLIKFKSPLCHHIIENIIQNKSI
jgi:hypothetical protein